MKQVKLFLPLICLLLLSIGVLSSFNSSFPLSESENFASNNGKSEQIQLFDTDTDSDSTDSDSDSDGIDGFVLVSGINCTYKIPDYNPVTGEIYGYWVYVSEMASCLDEPSQKCKPENQTGCVTTSGYYEPKGSTTP